MGIRRVLISAILTLGVAGSIVAASAMPAAPLASAAQVHVTGSSASPNMLYHT
jgi:hypothetical protein